MTANPVVTDMLHLSIGCPSHVSTAMVTNTMLWLLAHLQERLWTKG